MKQFLTIAAFGLLAFLPSLQAEVAVYRGVSRAKGDLSTTDGKTKVFNVYLVTDFETGAVATILFYRDNGHKRYSTSPTVTYSVASCDLPKGRTATTLSYTTSSTTSDTVFNHNLIYLRGTDGALVVQNSPVVSRIARPRAFKGIATSTSRDGGAGTFLEQNLGLTFQTRLTTQANNVSRAFSDVVADLIADLQSKQYEPAS